jgi:choline dehydrogenase-like flavoprotein
MFCLPSTSQRVDPGPRQAITARNEVILSAGTVGTPHILLNSGIGDRGEIAAHGITPLLHLPGVGKNLSDHLRLASNWFVNGRKTFDMINQNSTLSSELLRRWTTVKQGPLVDTFASHLYFARLPSPQLADPAAGPNSPHYELGFSVGRSELFSIVPQLTRSRMVLLALCQQRGTSLG